MDHIKDQRTGLISTTFILVGPYWWGPGAMAPLVPPKSGPGLSGLGLDQCIVALNTSDPFTTGMGNCLYGSINHLGKQRAISTQSGFPSMCMGAMSTCKSWCWRARGFHYPSWRPELTAWVDARPVFIIRQHGPSTRVVETGLKTHRAMAYESVHGHKSRTRSISGKQLISAALWTHVVQIQNLYF